MRFPHLVRVDEENTTYLGLKPQEKWVTVHAAFPCLVEALSAREAESVLGRIAQARYRISWRSGALEEGSRVLFGGNWHTVREVRSDAGGIGSRAMRISTAVLEYAQPAPSA